MDHEQSTKRFYDLIWPLRSNVLRLAHLLTGNAAEGEDLAQETLLKAFKSIGSFAEGTDVKAWLTTILRNARVDRLRAAGHALSIKSLDALEQEPQQPERQEVVPAETVWETPEEILNSFSDAQVIEALQKLPEEIRLTLLLVDVEQLDHRDAAAILAVPVGTIKSRTHRGRGRLREALLPLARQLRLVRE